MWPECVVEQRDVEVDVSQLDLKLTLPCDTRSSLGIHARVGPLPWKPGRKCFFSTSRASSAERRTSTRRLLRTLLPSDLLRKKFPVLVKVGRKTSNPCPHLTWTQQGLRAKDQKEKLPSQPWTGLVASWSTRPLPFCTTGTRLRNASCVG